MHLSNYEKETIIVFNEAEETASVYTCDKKLQNKLSEYALESKEVIEEKRDEFSVTYNLPKKWISIHRPRKLTEEERQKRALRAMNNFHKNKTEKIDV